jgi:hypothetical protein
MLAFWRPSTVRVSILYTSGMGVLLRRINAAHDSSDAHRMTTSPARATPKPAQADVDENR